MLAKLKEKSSQSMVFLLVGEGPGTITDVFISPERQ